MYEYENKFHKPSSILIHYQIEPQSSKINMMTELFAEIIMEPCFNILRTQKQLGYSVYSEVFTENGVQGITINVQSNKDVKFVENSIDEFVDSMSDYIKNLTDTEFDNYKKSLEYYLLIKPVNLNSLKYKFMKEIYSQQYNFNRTNIELPFLKKITKEDILEFHEVRVIKF